MDLSRSFWPHTSILLYQTYCDTKRQLFEYGHYAFCLQVVCVLTEYLSVLLVDVFGSKLLCSVCHYGDKLYKQGGTPERRSMQGFMLGSGCKCTRSFFYFITFFIIIIIKARHYRQINTTGFFFFSGPIHL